MRAKLAQLWCTTWGVVPRRMRKVIVAVIGGSLVVLGVALVVLPGPFTLPLVLAGFAVLASEFVWAGKVLEESRERARRVAQRARRVTRRGGRKN